MNQKTAIQFTIFISTFFLLWFALSQINFTGTKKYQDFSTKNEIKLGDILLNQVLLSNSEIKIDSLTHIVENIKNKICTENHINADLDIFIVKNEEINAYALPGNNIVIHSNLIQFCNTADELAAVMAHEIAHIHNNHVMKKLTQEIGVALLTAVIGNEYNGEIIREIIQMISTNAYSRELESEADAVAVEYLSNSGINPASLANFLFRFSTEYSDLPQNLVWVSSHPIAKERAAEILKLSNEIKFETKPVIDTLTWTFIQKELANH